MPNTFLNVHRAEVTSLAARYRLPAVYPYRLFAEVITGVFEALTKSAQTLRVAVGRYGAEESDHRHRRLLRPRCERPQCRATDERDELAPVAHSITMSARASTVGGISRPRALAVLRLITSSYLVGSWTGRSAGFAPLRILST